MKIQSLHTVSLAILASLFLTGCYTQLQTVHEYRIFDERESEREVPVTENRDEVLTEEERQQRLAELPEESQEEAYLYGYEDGITDGWTDAEEYYYKDYETERWYRDYGMSLATHPRHYEINNYYGYSPFAISYNFYRPFGHSRFGFSRWGWHDSFYSFYHDPFFAGYYDPYYGSYWGGYWGSHSYYRYPQYYGAYYGYPYYGNSYVFVQYYNRNTDIAPARDYGPRSTGLSGGGVVRTNRESGSVNRAALQPQLTPQAVINRAGDIRSTVRETGRTGTGTVTPSTTGRSTSSGTTVRSRGESPSPSTDRAPSAPQTGRSTGSSSSGSRSTGRSSESVRTPAPTPAPSVPAVRRESSSSSSGGTVRSAPSSSSGRSSGSSGSTGRSTGRSR